MKLPFSETVSTELPVTNLDSHVLTVQDEPCPFNCSIMNGFLTGSVCFLKPVSPVDPLPQTVGFQLPCKKRVLKMLAEVDVFAEALMIGLI